MEALADLVAPHISGEARTEEQVKEDSWDAALGLAESRLLVPVTKCQDYKQGSK